MLPDFRGLRQQSGDGDDLRSLKHTSDNRFSLSLSFQQFDKHRDGKALQGHRTVQPLQNHAAEPEPDYTDLFYKLWLTQPSWSPILLTADGWKTVKGSGKKKVPLTLGAIESAYRRSHIIGKRFGKLTHYLLIDIDINSPFHPQHQGYRPILDTMERLGLCRYLIVRSSTSGGIHIYFPLPEPVSAWELACTAHCALTADGIHIVSGQCELFPNKKAFNAEHHGHRLPLQDGSFLLDEDNCPISNHKADFVRRWVAAAALQDEVTLEQALTGKAVFAPLPPATHHALPPIAWTAFGQSNNIMRKLVNYGDRYAGHKTIADLAAWVKAIAPQLPGYQKFASPKSKQDIEQGDWPTRWAKSHFESAWRYSNSGSDHNAKVAHDAKSRIFAALERLCITADIGITKLWQYVSDISANCFNKGVAWQTFQKHKDEVLAQIARTRNLGLSSGMPKDVSSFVTEPVEFQAEPDLESEKKSYTQLLTLRCVIAIYSNAFSSLDTSKTAVEAPADESSKKGSEQPAELTIGQQVFIKLPGCPMNGVKTRVRGKTKDNLGRRVYRLDYRLHGQYMVLPVQCLAVVDTTDAPRLIETVIRATAAQLHQVLGGASPFVGPGFWEVRRSEVPAKAWSALQRLVRSGVTME